MSWNTLHAQVQDVVETVANIQEVSLTPKLRFTGYPAAYIVPSSNEGDYDTSSENIRTYAFRVVFFYETKVKGIAGAIAALRPIVDAAIDAFDQEDLKGSTDRLLGISLPAAYTFINVWATPVQWGELPEEELVTAELLVRVRLSVDIS